MDKNNDSFMVELYKHLDEQISLLEIKVKELSIDYDKSEQFYYYRGRLKALKDLKIAEIFALDGEKWSINHLV